MSEPRLILDGLRVIDLSTGLAGAAATLMLAESGADVVKVEPPDGDAMRGSAAFATFNRSKRSVVLDLSEADARARLDDLLADADVVVHSFHRAAAVPFGLDTATLSDRHPWLISCAITGWPADHADAALPCEETLVLARSGIVDEQRGNRVGPVYLRFPLARWGAAYLAAIGVLARLVHRQRSGRGGAADTSLLQARCWR